MSQPPIQLLSIPGAFDSAIRKIPKVDKGLNKLNANPKAKKAAKVASFLGFKIPFVDRPKPGGEGDDKSDCCTPTHPENRHDASKHDPEANKAGLTPEGSDQTVAPSAADPDKGTDPTPPAPATVDKKATDAEKSKNWSQARKTFESTAAPQRTVSSIHDRTKARFAASKLHKAPMPEPAVDDDAAESEPVVEPPKPRMTKQDVKNRVRSAKQKRVADALAGESQPAKARSPVSQAVKGQLGAAGVSHQAILARARKDMAGTQAARFNLHLDAAKGRAEFKRPQQEAARHQALEGLDGAFDSPAAD